MKRSMLFLVAVIATAQTTRYPGNVDSDSSLFVVLDNIQTSLSASMSTSDTAMVVASASGFVPNMIATICDVSTNTGKCTAWEHMLVTAVSGNVLTVTRGFAGTSARTHSSGRLVSVLIDSAHQKVLKDAVIAIENALGPNLGNISLSSPFVSAGSYNFTAYSCTSAAVCTPGGTTGMSLIAGANVLTMNPVPNGVNGSDANHYLYVSGGTGTAESCRITGGAGTSGSASGQIIVTCSNTHSGAWNIKSATNGQAEAISASGPNAVIWVPSSLPADPGPLTVPVGVTIWDYRGRTSTKIPYPGYEAWPPTNTTVYNSALSMGAKPENMLAIMHDPSYIVRTNFTAGTIIPAGSTEYERSAIFASCENYGGRGLPAGTIATQNACVGIKASGQAWANNSPVWGANFTAANTPGIDGQLTGLEIDVGTYTNDTPNVPKNGLQILVGGGQNLTAGDAIVIGGTTNGVQWRYGIFMGISALAPGGTGIVITPQAATPGIGIDLQGAYSSSAISISNASALRFKATNGTDGLVAVAANNTMFLQRPSQGDLQFLSDTGSVLWSLHGAGLISSGTTFGALGSPFKGQLVWCNDCTVASTCAGGGPGAFAFGNGTKWNCPF